MSVTSIVTALVRHRFHLHYPEQLLKEEVSMVLRERGIPFAREALITDVERVDFLCGTVGIEVKVAGSALSLARQIDRYGDSPLLSALVIVVTRERMTAIERWLSSSFTKPVHTVLLR